MLSHTHALYRLQLRGYGFLAFGVVLGVRGEFEPELECCVPRSRADDRVGIAPCIAAARFLLAFGVVPADVVS